MTTSTTWGFTLDIADILEEAFEMIGDELRTGYDYRTGRRSLDLLMLEWQNRGLHLWTVKNASQTLTAGQSDYTLSNEKLDIIEAQLRTDAGDSDKQTDITMTRMSISAYAQQSNKLLTGRPIQYFVERAPDAITVKVWPVPDSQQTYVLNYWYMERVEDTGSPASNNMDVPARFLPALTAGLAYKLAIKKGKIDIAPSLKAEYEEQYNLAADAARDKASFWIRPRVTR